jgi:hypothetical protein
MALFNLQRDTLKLYWFRLSSSQMGCNRISLASAVRGTMMSAALKKCDLEGVVQEAGKVDEAME